MVRLTSTELEDRSPRGIASFEEAFDTLLSQRPGVLASESGGELAWLKKARHRDADRWRNEGLPTRRNERWRYTNLSAISDSYLTIPEIELDASARELFPRFDIDAEAEIVLFNGRLMAEWSRFPTSKGVSVYVLSELFDECVNEGWTSERKKKFAAFREEIENSDADRENVFAAMNTSFMQDGVLIHVDSSVALKKPIVIVHLSGSDVPPESSDLPIVVPRVFATLDRQAQAGIVEVFSGLDQTRYFSNSVSDIHLADGARLSHCKVQLEGDEAVHIGTTRVHQKRDSFSEMFQFSFGSKLSRHDLHVSLDGKGAEAVVDGLYMVQGRQHVDNFTTIEHVVGETVSEQVYKGILDGESKAAFNGRIHIHQDAQKSNASQLNNNLLLSQKAEADTKPELEIYADDVKAAHGATVGQMDPEHIFYLQSRSIPREQAVQMLARGFAQDIVFRIKEEKIRQLMHGIVDQRCEAMHLARD